MRREHDSNHGSVCTSTESTAGRSRTIGAQLSPASARRVHLPAGGAEINAAGIERIDGHGVAQHVHVAIALRQALGERLPFVSAGAAAVDAQLSFERKMLRVALDRDDVNGFRLVRVNVDHEAEIGGQVAADLAPRVAGVVAAHHVPMLLHEQHVGARRVHGDVVNAVADLGGRDRECIANRSPWLMGFQVLPPSSVRKAPAAEMAM